MKSALTSSAPFIASVVCLVLSGCESAIFALAKSIHGTTQLDLRRPMAPIARNLAQIESQPSFQMRLGATDADCLGWIDDHRILVGLRGQNLRYGYPTLAPLCLIDTRSGSRIWTLERTGSAAQRWTVVAAESTLVMEESGSDERKLHGLSIATGTQLWERTIPLDAYVYCDFDSDQLLVVGHDKPRFERIAAATGSLLWATEPAEGKLKHPPLLAPGGMYLLTDSLNKIDPANGKRAFRQALHLSDATPSIVACDRGIVMHDGKRKLALLSHDDGSSLWAVEEPGPLQALSVIGDTVYLADSRIPAAEDIYATARFAARRCDDGALIWSRNEPLSVHSALHECDGNLLFTSHRTLEIWSAGTGSPRVCACLPHTVVENATKNAPRFVVRDFEWVDSQGPMPKPLWQIRALRCEALGDFRMTEHIESSDGCAHVAAETGLLSVDVRTGTVMHRFSFPQTYAHSPFTTGILASKLARSSGDQADIMKTLTVGTGALSMSATSARQRLSSAQMNTRNAEQTYGKSSSEYRAALQSNIAAAQAAHKADKAAAWGSVISSGRGVVESVGRLISRKFNDASLARDRLRLMGATSSYQNCVQWPYLIRPYKIANLQVGRTVMLIVDMRSGDWVELTADIRWDFASTLFVAAFPVRASSDRSALAVLAVGLDPEVWDVVACGEVGSQYMTPANALLTFEPQKLRWRPAGEYGKRSQVLCGGDRLTKLRAAVQSVKVGMGRQQLLEILGPPDPPAAPHEWTPTWTYAVEEAGVLQSIQLYCPGDPAGPVDEIRWTAEGPDSWVGQWPKRGS